MSGFEIIIRCDNCDDGIAEDTVGGYTPDRWMEYREVECPECDGRGEIERKVSMYENTQEILEDYPDAIKIKRLA